MASLLSAAALFLSIVLPSTAVQFGGRPQKPTWSAPGGVATRAKEIQHFGMRKEHKSAEAISPAESSELAETPKANSSVSQDAPVESEAQRGAGVNPSQRSTAGVAETNVAAVDDQASWPETQATLNPAESSTAGRAEAEVAAVEGDNREINERHVQRGLSADPTPFSKVEETGPRERKEEGDEEEEEEEEEEDEDEDEDEEKEKENGQEKGTKEEEEDEEAKEDEKENKVEGDDEYKEVKQGGEKEKDKGRGAEEEKGGEEEKEERKKEEEENEPDFVESSSQTNRAVDPAASSEAAEVQAEAAHAPQVPENTQEVEEEVSVDVGSEAEPLQAEAGTPELPTDPGCFLRTPSGCPNHPSFSSKGWRHDTYAEKYTRAGENFTECEVTRKARLVAYCGAEDAETLFVPSIWGGQLGENEVPMEPGCYVRTPSGCPNHPTFNSSAWRHEEYGERATMAKVNRTACEVDRQDSVRHWCGAEDAEMLFVPPPPPGCYVRTPWGCPNHPDFASTDWKLEEFGENFTLAKENRTVCELTRRLHLAHWCGTVNVHMLFIPAEQEVSGSKQFRKNVATPTEPGCFMLAPSGCPNHPSFGRDGWEHDRVGELSGAKRHRAFCEGGRKEQVSQWCGTEDVEAIFVAAAEPGCYVRTPSGCPNHPHFGGSNWTHDNYGEMHRNAGLDRLECEVTRKTHVMHWCGTDDVQMSFEPPDWESLIVAGPGGGEVGPDGALQPPTQPGCYVRTPSGCPSHPSFSSSRWKYEEYGERNTRASQHRATCEVTRKAHVAHWCGAEDVEMLFVPTPGPGCYMRTPSGCPNHPEYGSGTWRRDEEGGNATESQTDRTVCEVLRQADIALWCGARDAETLFLPPPIPRSRA